MRALMLLALCVASACSASQREHNSVTQEKPRIVAAGGSITEILFALGVQDSLVGVDSSSLYPVGATQIANVGYYRQLSLEGVVSVAPTLILGLDTMGPSNVLAQLESLNIQVNKLPLERSVEGLMSTIQRLGGLVGKPFEAEKLIEQTRNQLSQVPSLNNSNQRVIFLMSASSNGLMAAGTNTVPHLIFELLQLDNPLDHIDGFKPVSIEVVMSISPDLVLMPNHQKGGRSAAEICSLPSLALWAKSKGCHIKFVDSLSYLGMTPRLPQAANQVGEWVKAIGETDA